VRASETAEAKPNSVPATSSRIRPACSRWRRSCQRAARAAAQATTEMSDADSLVGSGAGEPMRAPMVWNASAVTAMTTSTASRLYQLRQPTRTMSAKAAAANSRQSRGEGPGTQMMSPWVRAVRWPTRRGICQLGTTT